MINFLIILPQFLEYTYTRMSIKYPDSTNYSNIYADERTSSYYSSKSLDLSDKYSKADNLISK
ncbi:MAG: hypothetical protein PF693_07510 [Spirochaetia bacterium]|nr:hypothetical protein [Spirochaetia bacterium]